MFNFGTVALTACTITGNSATHGGGIQNQASYASLTLNDCTLSGNSSQYGGALGNNGTANLTDCTISANSSGNLGGGVLAWSGETALTNCAITGNSATHGGGIQNQTSYASLTLNDCTLSGNSSQYGGALGNNGTANLTDCTISANSSGNLGGGVLAWSGETTLTNCTLSSNAAADSGGGVFAKSGTTTLGNTIVAGNTAGTGPDVDGSVTSLGNNLIGETDGSSGWVSSDLTGTVANPLNPLLAPLGDNGGPTQTMALLPGSPAIEAGNTALIPAGVTTDQRGYPRIYAGAVDIGAVQLQLTLVSIAVSPSNPTLDLGVPAQFTATGTISDGQTLDMTSSVTWASATPAVATISGTGVATALAPGTSAITASQEGVTSPDDTLTVINFVSIAVSPGNPELAQGVAAKFIATGTLADGSTVAAILALDRA